MGVKDWLQVFRAQTAPATVLSILLPYLFSGGRDPIMVAIIVVLGALTHYASFGHNSLMDYFFDTHDPNKNHHPLESGRISLDQASILINGLMVILALLWIVVSIELSPSPTMSLIFLILYIVFGQAYNDWTDKLDENSYIYIAGCFMSLTAFGWSLGSGKFNMLGYMIIFFSGLTIYYQIAWEGNLKDLWNPKERNLLSKLGFRIINGRVVGPRYVNRAFMFVRLGLNTVALSLMAVMIGSLTGLAFLAVMTAVESYAVGRIHLELEQLNRSKLLELMGLAEAFEFFRLAVLLPIVFWLPIVMVSILYFLVMNRVLWGSNFGPRV